MYIPEFWAGVVSTMFVEVVILIMYAFYDSHKRK